MTQHRRRSRLFALVLAVWVVLLLAGLAAEILAHVWLIIAGIAVVGIVRYLSRASRGVAHIPARPTTPKTVTSTIVYDDPEPEPEPGPESRSGSDRDRLVNDRRSGAHSLFDDDGL